MLVLQQARNCGVTQMNVVKVGDFSLTRHVVDDEYTASEGTKFATKWAAPEVISHARFSSKSDVWSYGEHMYFCLCTHTYIHTYIHSHIHTLTHTYVRTYVHTYIHTYIHTYTHQCCGNYSLQVINYHYKYLAISRTHYHYHYSVASSNQLPLQILGYFENPLPLPLLRSFK